jgi:hypothetical protein
MPASVWHRLTPSVPLSQHLRPLLVRVAAAHPATKFLSIPAQLCIPNYPDKNVPTLLVYRDGEMLGQVVAGMGLNGMRTTVKGEFDWWLASSGRSRALSRRV